MAKVTYPAAKLRKPDAINDYERRELDCWIAENIEQHVVLHDSTDVVPEQAVRLSDIAWRDFQKRYKGSDRAKGPYPVCPYSSSPAVALNVFQTTEYAEGWWFDWTKERWVGYHDGFNTLPCKSLSLCMMLALQTEYQYQNHKEP